MLDSVQDYEYIANSDVFKEYLYNQIDITM